MNQREIEQALPQFEGLVFETARQIVARGVELEFDDVRQLLRIKVWHAVQRYAADHPKGMPLRRFVFMCVANLRKDIEKKPRRHDASIDALRGCESGAGTPLADWFDARYLSVDQEEVFALVEDGSRLSETLSPTERRVVALRVQGWLLIEIDRELGLSRAQRERVMRSIREKLAHLDPTPPARTAPLRPLPQAEPRPRIPALAA